MDASWPRLIDACGKISDAKIFIDETSGISPYEIRARCRRLKATQGIDCIMIDYLQLMDLKQKVESRERAVAEISKSLKAIAKELQIPVIALAQLNRGIEGRSDRKPMLSDLRESGCLTGDTRVHLPGSGGWTGFTDPQRTVRRITDGILVCSSSTNSRECTIKRVF